MTTSLLGVYSCCVLLLVLIMQQCDRGHYGLVVRQNSFMMNEEEECKFDDHPSTKSESDEEDYESFFLQPASSPYNIKEKIAEANKLLEKDLLNGEKPIRVKFRAELVDFEPDLTDDDVQSIESYTEEVIEELKYVIQDKQLCDIEEEIIEESIIESIIELNHQHEVAREEAGNDLTSSFEETEELVVGEIKSSQEIPEDLDEVEEIVEIIENIEGLSELQEFENVQEVLEDLPQPPEEVFLSESNQEIDSSSSFQDNRKKVKIFKKKKLPREINCKKHCIEALESRLEYCINNLRVSEKPNCPTLRLHRQKCCSEGCKIEQKLPLYTGLHSEYGLSSSQIQRLTKQKELIKLREEKERELTAAYKLRKIQQNEIIFRQWLKDINARKLAEKEKEKLIMGRHYGISTRKGVKSEKLCEKQRPKTANCLTSLQLRLEGRNGKLRRRPHTTSSSTARIFIEIPRSLLNDGFNLGELFIKNQCDSDDNIRIKTKGQRKRLHMVASG